MCSISFPDPLPLSPKHTLLVPKGCPPSTAPEDWPAAAAALLCGSQRILADRRENMRPGGRKG